MAETIERKALRNCSKKELIEIIERFYEMEQHALERIEYQERIANMFRGAGVA